MTTHIESRTSVTDDDHLWCCQLQTRLPISRPYVQAPYAQSRSTTATSARALKRAAAGRSGPAGPGTRLRTTSYPGIEPVRQLTVGDPHFAPSRRLRPAPLSHLLGVRASERRSTGRPWSGEDRQKWDAWRYAALVLWQPAEGSGALLLEITATSTGARPGGRRRNCGTGRRSITTFIDELLDLLNERLAANRPQVTPSSF
jgi:hypothetical protein